MFKNGQLVTIDKDTLIAEYIKANHISITEALHRHEMFFKILNDIKYFIIKNIDCSWSDIFILKIVWKDKIPDYSPWRDTVAIKKCCLPALRRVKSYFINLSYYV